MKLYLRTGYIFEGSRMYSKCMFLRVFSSSSLPVEGGEIGTGTKLRNFHTRLNFSKILHSEQSVVCTYIKSLKSEEVDIQL
jgi:hypothetical protein